MGLTKKNFYQKPEVKPYVIEFSFDDGYASDMRSASILEKYHQKGTFYIVLDYIGKPEFLTWEQIKELEKRGHEIGSHTVSHPQDLKVLYDNDLHYEIQNSKDMLETALGHHISKFCYPRGRFDDRVKQFVSEAGYLHARVTGELGKITFKNNLEMPGTIHIFPREDYKGTSIVEFTKSTIERLKKEGGYCNIWAHGNDLDKYNLWEVLEEIVTYVSENK